MLVLNPQLDHHLDEYRGEKIVKDENGALIESDEKEQIEEPPPADDAQAPTINTDYWYLAAFWTILMALVAGYILGKRSSAIEISELRLPDWPSIGGRAIFLVGIAWLILRVQRWLHFRAKRSKEAVAIECRLQLSQLLGSIEAPPLIMQQCDRRPWKNPHKSSVADIRTTASIVTKYFATPHAELLLEMDRCLQRLRTRAGLSLGVGADSPAVDRAERVALRRRAVCCRAPSRLRQTLGDCMLQQFRSLRRIETHMSDTAKLEEEDLPEILSIGWLAGFRRRLGEQLARTLSVVDIGTTNQEINKAMYHSGQCAQEARQHLMSSRQLIVEGKRNASFLEQRMVGLYKTFSAAHVALGACQESLSEACPVSSEAIKWFEIFDRLLQEATQAQHVILSHHETSNEPESKDDREIADLQSIQTDERIMRDTFEHGGHSSFENKTIINVSTTAKTLVFAGVGTAPKEVRKQATEANYLTELQPNGKATQQEMLQELQTRLAAITQEEQLERCEDEQDKNSHTDKERSSNATTSNQRRTTSMFLGVSVDLLREAQSAMSNEGSTTKEPGLPTGAAPV